ncbi:hypothetical protein [Nostoc sp.]|uniref:hypothetical protein n=1 Tax=Nostoc sp. TaxID=1180 RepID=UPI002FF3FEF0
MKTQELEITEYEKMLIARRDFVIYHFNLARITDKASSLDAVFEAIHGAAASSNKVLYLDFLLNVMGDKSFP